MQKHQESENNFTPSNEAMSIRKYDAIWRKLKGNKILFRLEKENRDDRMWLCDTSCHP